MRNAPYIHPSNDSILKLWQTFSNALAVTYFTSGDMISCLPVYNFVFDSFVAFSCPLLSLLIIIGSTMINTHHFHTFVTELWPLIDVRISFRSSFPLNILRKKKRSNFTKFCICIDIDNI